jgi:hypothetical protein
MNKNKQSLIWEKYEAEGSNNIIKHPQVLRGPQGERVMFLVIYLIKINISYLLEYLTQDMLMSTYLITSQKSGS